MLMYVMYGVYALLGVVLIVVGIAAMTKKLMQTFCVGLIIVGVAMLFVGAGSVYVTMQKMWFVMAIIFLIDVALFLGLFSTAVTALFISVGGGDPVDYIFDKYWDDVRSYDGSLKDQGSCYLSQDTDLSVDGETGQWPQCEALYGNGDVEISETCWDAVYGYAGNCTELLELMTAGTYDDSGCDGNTMTYELCTSCSYECKSNFVDNTKANMEPAAIASLAIFFYFVITAALNSFCLHLEEENEDGEEEFGITGIWKILVLVFNGIVALLGLVIVVVGIIVLIKTNSDCPLEPQAECPTTAILMLIIVGASVLVTAGFVIAGMFMHMQILIVVANLVFTVLCLALLLITCGVGLAAGVLGEASTQYDDNWEEARDNIRLIDEETELFCLVDSDDCTKESYGVEACEKGKAACIEEIEDKVEEYASTFSIVGIVVSVFMVVIMYFTYLSIKIWRADDGDDDDDDDDE